MNNEYIRIIQDKMLEKVEPKKQKWDDKNYMFCPVCGKRMELGDYDE